MDELARIVADEASLVPVPDEPKEFEVERGCLLAARRMLRPSNIPVEAEATSVSQRLVEAAAARCLVAMSEGSSFVELDNKDDKSTIDALKESPACSCDDLLCEHDSTPLFLDCTILGEDGKAALYLTRFARDEMIVAKRLQSFAPRRDEPSARASGAISELSTMAPELNEGQEAALSRLMRGGLMVLTGGPGTGKTTVITRIIALSHGLGVDLDDIRLVAPTGKAAARVGESINAEITHLNGRYREHLQGYEPQPVTLHRLLGAGYSALENFSYGREEKLSGRLFIVDEVSMVSLPLMRRFLEALPDQAGVVLVGDPDQLSSVEIGTVLSDLVGGMSKNGDWLVRLRESYRSEEEVAGLAAAVNEGNVGAVKKLLCGGDTVCQRDALDEKLLNELVGHFNDVARAACGGDHEGALAGLSKVQLLCTNRHGALGSERWNQTIASRVEGRGGRATFGEPVGAPVMIARNQRDLGVNNGDVGIVVEHEGALQVCLPSPCGVRYVSRALLSDVELAYAITVHKSQGSQYDRVIVQLGGRDNRLNVRELLYTGVSRARSSVVIVGDAGAIEQAVKNPVKRASLLGRRVGC